MAAMSDIDVGLGYSLFERRTLTNILKTTLGEEDLSTLTDGLRRIGGFPGRSQDAHQSNTRCRATNTTDQVTLYVWPAIQIDPLEGDVILGSQTSRTAPLTAPTKAATAAVKRAALENMLGVR